MGARFPWLHPSQDWLEAELLAVLQRIGFAQGSGARARFVEISASDLLIEPDAIIAPGGRRPIRSDAAESIAIALRDGIPLPPIEVTAIGSLADLRPTQWRLYDGFHRYHLSRAMDVGPVPVIWMVPFSDPSVPGMALFRRKDLD